MNYKLFFLLTILAFGQFFGYGQQNADDIVGYYYVVDPFSGESSQMYIYKVSTNHYEAKIVWVDRVEKEHFIGLVFLKKLTYNSQEKEWQDGEIKYPGKKGTFKVYMKKESEKKMKVRAYWGLSMFGKTMYWHKEDKLRVR